MALQQLKRVQETLVKEADVDLRNNFTSKQLLEEVLAVGRDDITVCIGYSSKIINKPPKVITH